ncbi:MAG TPA: acyl-CoA dehydrogenase family protein [Steroidobacter sp.]|jgi:hypothetical protein|nr:acyl-CoA dehydrogenase family protein [Steroidobacter sp.]
MLDERWSDEVEEIGGALRKLLSAKSTTGQVRAAEATEDGRDRGLEADLTAFGLDDLEAAPDLFARISYELGRALAATPYVETIPVLAVLRRPGVSCGFDGPVPACVPLVAVHVDDAVYIEQHGGCAHRSSAGDWLVDHRATGSGERVGDGVVADRIARYAALTEAARLTGAGQALLLYALEYARERKQFGKAIGSYQAIAHRLANAATLLDAAELLVRKAAFSALPEAGGDGSPQAAFAIMVRAKAIETAKFVATNVHQTFGGNGFSAEYDVQLYSRRLRSWAMRGRRTGADLAELARMVLDSQRRDSVRLMWHYDVGMPLPRWAREADATS